MAVAAAVIAIALAVELHAHSELASAAKQAKATRPTAAQADKALDDLDQVTDLRPGSPALLVAAGLDFKLHRYAAAERFAAHATRREPDNFSTWLTLGVIRRTRGDERGARAAFSRAHVLNPLYPVPR